MKKIVTAWIAFGFFFTFQSVEAKITKTCRPLDSNQVTAANLYRGKFLSCRADWFDNVGLQKSIAKNDASTYVGADKPYGKYHILKNISGATCVEKQGAAGTFSQYTSANYARWQINPNYQYFITRRKIGNDCYDFLYDVSSVAVYSQTPQTADVQCVAYSNSDSNGNRTRLSVDDLRNDAQAVFDACNTLRDNACSLYVDAGLCLYGPDIVTYDYPPTVKVGGGGLKMVYPNDYYRLMSIHDRNIELNYIVYSTQIQGYTPHARVGTGYVTIYNPNGSVFERIDVATAMSSTLFYSRSANYIPNDTPSATLRLRQTNTYAYDTRYRVQVDAGVVRDGLDGSPSAAFEWYFTTEKNLLADPLSSSPRFSTTASGVSGVSAVPISGRGFDIRFPGQSAPISYKANRSAWPYPPEPVPSYLTIGPFPPYIALYDMTAGNGRLVEKLASDNANVSYFGLGGAGIIRAIFSADLKPSSLYKIVLDPQFAYFENSRNNVGVFYFATQAEMCVAGSGEGVGQYKDTKKQNYCSPRQSAAECAQAFGCVWSGSQCDRQLACTYPKAAADSRSILCSRYVGDQVGCERFASCQYSGGVCARR